MHPHMMRQQRPDMLTSPSSNMVVPRTLELGDDYDDGLSVVSGITMDMRLIQGARNWDGTTTYDDEDEDDDPRHHQRNHGMQMKNKRNNHLHVDSDEEDAGAPPLTGGRRPGADDMYDDTRPGYGAIAAAAAGERPMRHPSGEYYGGRGMPGGGYGGNEYYDSQMPQINEGTGYGGGGGGGGHPGGGQYGIAPGLDADGYPIADSNYGWSNQSDMLPPGATMDSLLQSTGSKPPRSRGAAMRPPRNPSAELAFQTSGEIVFNPQGGGADGGGPYGSHRMSNKSPPRSRSPKPPLSNAGNMRPPLFAANPSQLIGRSTGMPPSNLGSDPFGADDEEDEDDGNMHQQHMAMAGMGGMGPPHLMQSSSGAYGMDDRGMSKSQHHLLQSRSGGYPVSALGGGGGGIGGGIAGGAGARLTHSQSSTYGAGGKDPALVLPPRLATSQSSGYDTISSNGAPPKDRWANTVTKFSGAPSMLGPASSGGTGGDLRESLPPMPKRPGRRSIIPHQQSGPMLDDGHHDDVYEQEVAAAQAAANGVGYPPQRNSGRSQDAEDDDIHSEEHDELPVNRSNSMNNGGGKPAAFDRQQLSQIQAQQQQQQQQQLPQQQPMDVAKKMSHVSYTSNSTAPPLRRPDLRGRPDDNILMDPSMGPNGEMLNDPQHASAIQSAAAANADGMIDIHDDAITGNSNNVQTTAMPPAAASQQQLHSPLPPMSDKSVRDMARRLSTGPFPNEGANQMAPAESKKEEEDDDDENNTVADIPAILQCVNLEDAEPYLRERAFSSLTQVVWKLGEPAKAKIVEYNGIGTLVNAMWSDIGNANVQTAAANLLLAIAASAESDSSEGVMSMETSESACDALLFSLRTHEDLESIQLTGCCIFSCLAAASGANRGITDGTLSGAVSMVVDAMFKHQESKVIQKAGIQALYNQCVLSSNSGGNKRSVLEAKVDGGNHSGVDVIVSAMNTLRDELSSLELACKLCWCLASNEDLCKLLSASSTILHQVVDTAQTYHVNPEAGALYEAIFGMLGNMAHLEQNRSAIQEVGAIPFILDGMRFHRNDETVNLEACAALANLANTRPIRDSIVKAGGIGAIIRAMQAFISDVDVVEEAIRALVCIAIDSDDATKEILSMPQVIQSISRASEAHDAAGPIQEMCATLIASLIMSNQSQQYIVESGGIDIVLRALNSTPEEKVQAAACVAFRNLASQLEDSDVLLKNRSIRTLIKAMEANEASVTVQLNACLTLWYLADKTKMEPGDIVDQQGVRCIVKAMQTHMESGELLETACGALWSLVDESVDRKKDVVASGAIDAVTCALVMHPDRTGTLEKACGVLSNVSEGPLAEAIANAQGVSIVVEAMRSNFQCIPLLETGCVVLRNILVQFPDFSSEAEGAISTIINAMRDNPKEVNFQREACSALWVMAAQSENCQSKILALDGVSVLMKSLDHNSEIPQVQEVAWGAFNQLAADNM